MVGRLSCIQSDGYYGVRETLYVQLVSLRLMYLDYKSNCVRLVVCELCSVGCYEHPGALWLGA